jgi:hypothetical protein
MYIDLIRKRFHSPNRKQGYDCRYLGIDWIETDSFEVENYAVCSIELKKVWFTRENTVEKYKKMIDKGEKIILINIPDLSFYKEKSWKKI